MSDESLRQKENQTSLNKIETIAMAALAGGTEAVFLYKNGGNKLLSSGIRTAEKFLRQNSKEISNVFSRTEKDDNLINFVERHLKGNNNELKRIFNEEKNNITINQEGNKSLIGYLADIANIKGNLNSYASQFYNSDLKMNLFKDFGNTYGRKSDNNLNAIENFIDTSIDKFTTFIEGEGSYSNELKFNDDEINKYFTGTDITIDEAHNMLNKVISNLKEKEKNLKGYTESKKDFFNNLIDTLYDYESMEKRFGSKNKPKKLDNVFDQKVTVNEILNNEAYAQIMKDITVPIKSKNDFIETSAYDLLKKAVNRNSKIGELYIDNTIKKDAEGNLYSVNEFYNKVRNFAKEFANTIPGKISKIKGILDKIDQPRINLSETFKIDPILGDLEKKNNTILSNNYLYILGKTYKIDLEKNLLEHVKELDNAFLVSGEHGTTQRLYKAITGEMDTRYIPKQNKWSKTLDLQRDIHSNIFTKVSNFVNKYSDEDWGRNLFEHFLYPDIDGIINHEMNLITGTLDRDIDTVRISEDYFTSYYKKLIKLNNAIGRTTSPLKHNLIKDLYKNISLPSREILDSLLKSDEEFLKDIISLSTRSRSPFKNEDLNNLVKRYITNPKKAVDSIAVISDKKILGETVRGVKITEMLRKEAAKEAFLRHIHANGSKFSSITELFDKTKMTVKDKNEAKYLSNWAILQHVANLYSNDINTISNLPDTNIMIDTIKRAEALFSTRQKTDTFSVETKFIKDFRENMLLMSKEKYTILDAGFGRDVETIKGHKLNKYVYLKKTISPLEMINNLNDNTKVKAFFKQFVAGRNNISNITEATLTPYFLLYRLMEPLSEIGLGFSNKSTGSSTDLLYSIMLRRVLPLALGGTALSYVNDMFKTHTGTSLSGAGAISLANLDLAKRKIFDVTGLSSFFKTTRQINPIEQYLFGRQYQDYEERKDYYRKGYEPVRSGRWWNFGSTSELRGGKIDYFEPNIVTRINSNWHDIGIYGSVDEKWKHSLIPTPTHPFSTLRYLLDPYWLEKKHYKDRPYPLTAPMFESDQPWSPFLNATIGQIIKPQKKMHQEELQDTLTDVRDIISGINNSIKSKANSFVELDNRGVITPFTAVSINNLYANGQNEALMNPDDIDNYKLKDIISYIGNSNNISYNQGQGITFNSKDYSLSLKTRLTINPIGRGILSKIENNINPLSIIAEENGAIIVKANKKNVIMTPDAIFKTKAKNSLDVLYNSEALADLRTLSSGNDYIKNIYNNSSEIAGIYGFLLEAVAPRKTKKIMFQNAEPMKSFSRYFWDASIGGLGGEFMEIARRFFPHEMHDEIRLNPIRNTMPDWIPDRFKRGDPYAILPNGEMRLPGKGYESIYKLHPDQFGYYGAYDRMKILADIAPYSSEYKLWRKIATQTIKDKALKEKMKDIKQRVIEQSKAHDFYPYRFLGKQLESTTGVIKNISGTKFTLMGSNEKFTLAGIKAKDEDVKKYLREGMKIRVKYDKDKYNRYDNSGNIPVIAMINGENINKEMLDKKEAVRKTTDNSIASYQASLTQNQVDTGKIFEFIGHAPIPYIHSKYLRINSPLESYKQEQVYGTSYATWNHPIKGFLQPSFQKAWSYGLWYQALGFGALKFASNVEKNGGTLGKRALSYIAVSALNPGAFTGAVVGKLLRPTGFNTYVKTGAKIGAYLSLAGYTYTRLDSPIQSAINFALLGAYTAKIIGKSEKHMAIAGSLVGLAASSLKNPRFNFDKMFGPYIPNKDKKKWEIEEYYDRLKYIKYMGLYEKASRVAKRKEHIDIKKILNKIEYNEKIREKLREELLSKKTKLSNTNKMTYNRETYEALKEIDKKLNALNSEERNKITLKAGKYTRSALAYKQAAKSTIYGLDKNATWSQILEAVPRNMRDYVLEFSKEKNPKKRKEILKYMSPYQRKVMQIAWGEKYKEAKSNANFFSRHNLPGPFWAGWQPDVDLDNVEIKTIKNEGLQLADLGFYDSKLTDPIVQGSPTIDMHQQTSAINLRKNLITTLLGAGLVNVDVSVEPSTDSTIQIISNITRITDYKIKNSINNALGRTFY